METVLVLGTTIMDCVLCDENDDNGLQYIIMLCDVMIVDYTLCGDNGLYVVIHVCVHRG